MGMRLKQRVFQGRGFLATLGGWLLVGLIAGCSSAHYRKSADTEVYRIIDDAERRIFGRTNTAFTIDTRYSTRAPASVLPAEIVEDRMATNRRILRITDALQLGKAYSREYQTQREQLYLRALALTGTRYQFSPQFFASSTAQLAGTPDALETGSIGSQAGMDKFFRTGGRLSVALANDLLRFYTGGQGDQNSSLISMVLSQPLFRGFGRNNPTVENLTQAEREVIYALRSYHLYENQFAVNIVQEYYRLLGQKVTLANDYTNYLRRVDTRKYQEARSVDRVGQSQVDDARTSELSARVSYINSVASYLTQLDAFKTRLGLSVNESIYLDDADLQELTATGLIPVDIDRNAAFRIAVARHMDVLNAIDRFEDSKRKVRVAADQLRADLNLFANASVRSEPPDDYTNFNFNDAQYTAGVKLDLPIDRLAERNTYRERLVAFESQLRSLSLTLDGFKDRIDRGLRTLQQQRLNYLSRQLQVDVSRRRVEMNEIMLEAGRVQVRDLREAQDSLIDAQNALTAAVVDYLQARLQLLLDIGLLETKVEKFWLKDPLEGAITEAMRGVLPTRQAGEDLVPPADILEPKP